MEPAKDLVERPLPSLTQENGTTHPSVSSEIVSPRSFHEWENFATEVLQTCASLDLNALIPLTYDQDNEFVVASELGLTGRMCKHACDPVIRALAVTDMSKLRFADYQALRGYNSDKVPDILMLSFPDGIARLVLEMKTFWTLELQNYPVAAGHRVLAGIQHHLGQLVAYMRSSSLKFGVLSTYKSTVFVKRTANYRFEMSLPIPHDAVQPSVRQCFVAMAVLSWNDPSFTEPPGFDENLLVSSPSLQRHSPYAHHQSPNLQHHASTHSSPFSNLASPPMEGPSRENLGPQSILFGHDDVIARYFVNCHRQLMGSATMKTKAVFEVTWDGQPAIAKCWGRPFYQMYADETKTYQMLGQRNPHGHPCFAQLLQHGKIHCSSIFPDGYILILTRVEGELLTSIWGGLSSTERAHIRAEVHKAVVALRDIGLISVDCGKHNVLYNKQSGVTTLVDFEMVQAVESDTLAPDAPEMWAIFGPPSSSPWSRHDGG